jgi:dephospho-CoA kinase
MYLVGLTGGIAAGKSTVAKRWAEYGAVEIDADQLARDVIAPGTSGAAELREVFGEDVFNEDGTLNRAALGAEVFSKPERLKQLEAIIHPRVKKLAQQLIETQAEDAIVIYNVPLLVEASVDLPFDKIVTVEAPAEKQIDRLVSIRNMDRGEAERRISSQASPAQRANAADIILNSNQDLHKLLKDTDQLWKQIVREASLKQND